MNALIEFLDKNPDKEVTFMTPPAYYGSAVAIHMLKRGPGKLVTANECINRKKLRMTRGIDAAEYLVKETLQRLADRIDAAYQAQEVPEAGNTQAKPARRPGSFS